MSRITNKDLKSKSLKELLDQQEDIRNKSLDKIQRAILQEAAGVKERSRKEEELLQKGEKVTAKAPYVKMEHIDALKVPYDVLFFLAPKNSGKTRNIIFNRMKEAVASGSKFVFGRVSKDELDSALQDGQLNFGDKHEDGEGVYPYYPIKKGGKGVFIERKYIPEQRFDNQGILIEDQEYLAKKSNLRSSQLPTVGIATVFKTANKTSSGGEYLGYKYIIFDEILSGDDKKIISSKQMEGGAAFVSTITRKKKGVKVYLCGNLTSQNDEILKFYEIKRTDTLRYIKKHDSNILFINAGSRFSGDISSQGGAVATMSAKYAAQFLANTDIRLDKLLIDDGFAEEFKAKGAYLVEDKGNFFLITLREGIPNQYDEDPSPHYVAELSRFEAFNPRECIIYTNSTAYADNGNLTYIASIDHLFKQLYLLLHAKKLKVTDKGIYRLLTTIEDSYYLKRMKFL